MEMGMERPGIGSPIGRRLLLVILAAVLAVEILELHLLVGAQFVPPNPQDIAAKIRGFSATFGKGLPDCYTPSDEDNTFDADSLPLVAIKCIETDPYFLLRLCDEAEIDLYIKSIRSARAFGVSTNINCNFPNWPTACNAGWAGRTGVMNSSIQRPPTNVIPVRVLDPLQCCEGFFCPPGLTCAIPCPKGAYCPLAYYNTVTRSCAPYYYPPIPGTYECGGADLWLNYKDSQGIFCGGLDDHGTYCPDSITKKDCPKGHFCRVGSTVESKCSLFARCNKHGLKSQDLKVQGILLAVILSVSLVVIYTCSDRCMHIRERRRTKAREIAATQARQRASAAERWKRAKECRTKKAAAILSPTQACEIKSKGCTSGTHIPSSEVVPIEPEPLAVEQDSTDARIHLGSKADDKLEKREFVVNLHNPTSPHAAGSSRSSWSNDLYPDEGSRSIDLYDAVQLSPVYSGLLAKETGLPAGEEINGVPKAGKALASTRSQIYNYAYGEIEKEKVKQQSKPPSVNEVVEQYRFREMLAGPGRLEIELKFIDLCLVLKGTGKKILRYVTGELRPRRVTAVMGPSGAGKTTFLNALAGKETGSVITGQVFINGLPGSIQAYKRIIGFVPQDDIVHGSLTVEENLTFSAKYRLPVEMQRRDRVLVVERIINRLNLASIRNALVGTVENRGISGGQRKRVNVGLELVIEPSLLLLDEPISGLDSTSSRLVVQSLAREASLGVNVCLVVHQPSHGLFRMFDDVILFAKGGYAVYMGPTAEIDAYFSSLGLEVPYLTNPPDYYMDVLEGEAAPDNDLSFDVKSLPVLWMCLNGYRIPQEVQETAGGKKMEREDPSRISYDAPKTFVQEVWDELKILSQMRWDILKMNLERVKNLSGRQTPGFLSQYFLILERETKQRFRESWLVLQDYLILLIAGICLGLLSNWTDVEIKEEGYIYTIVCLSLLVMIASLRTFTVDKMQFWRESSSGVNKLAYFLAKDTVDYFNIICKPLVYLSTFYYYNDPRATFRSTYLVTLALTYCCTGMAYVVAILLKPQPAQLVCVFLPVVAFLLVSEPLKGSLATLQKVSYAFWAHQGFTISNAEKYSGVWLVQRCIILMGLNFSIKNFDICIIILMCYGIGSRILAFLCLILYNRERQK